jgi:hypothetical protein
MICASFGASRRPAVTTDRAQRQRKVGVVGGALASSECGVGVGWREPGADDRHPDGNVGGSGPGDDPPFQRKGDGAPGVTNMSGAGTCGQGPVPTLMSRSGGPTTNTLVRVDFLLLDHAALNWFGRTGPWRGQRFKGV